MAGATREKVIVRSNGVVTYVGKDIANQFWKFGLLGKDFHYRPFATRMDGATLFASTSDARHGQGGAAGVPHFGDPLRGLAHLVVGQRRVPAADLARRLRDEPIDQIVGLDAEPLAPRDLDERTVGVGLGDDLFQLLISQLDTAFLFSRARHAPPLLQILQIFRVEHEKRRRAGGPPPFRKI